MRLLKKNLERNGVGSVTLIPDESEDMVFPASRSYTRERPEPLIIPPHHSGMPTT